MSTNWNVNLCAIGALVVASSWYAVGPAKAQQAFTLTSETFKDGQMLPRKAANKNPQNPNCVGENVSPQLSWTGVPAGTKSFALTMVDPEGRGGLGVFHWVAYGIPANVTSFAEGEVSKESDKYVGGKSTQGVRYYSGPCTPPRLATSLYLRNHRHGSRAEGAAARPDAARAACEAAGQDQGGRRRRRSVCEACELT